MDVNYRRCVACRRVAHRREFFRLVRDFDTRAVHLDGGMGRSAYLCKTGDCLRLAQKKNRLGRALRAPIPDEIFAILHNRVANAGHLTGDRSHPT